MNKVVDFDLVSGWINHTRGILLTDESSKVWDWIGRVWNGRGECKREREREREGGRRRMSLGRERPEFRDALWGNKRGSGGRLVVARFPGVIVPHPKLPASRYVVCLTTTRAVPTATGLHPLSCSLAFRTAPFTLLYWYGKRLAILLVVTSSSSCDSSAPNHSWLYDVPY